MLTKWNNPILKIESVDRLHWVSQSCRVNARTYSALAYRVEGEAVIRTGAVEARCGPRDILYLPQGMAYEAEYTNTSILVIHFVTAWADRSVEVCHPTDPSRIQQLFLDAYDLWQSRRNGASVLAMSSLYRVIGEIASPVEEESPAAYRVAVGILNERFREPGLTVGEICRAAGIGETRFRALFFQQYQKPPVSHLTELRLEYARTLLAEGRTVEEAAVAAGFQDPKYFARVVKKTWGCTPRDLKSYGK